MSEPVSEHESAEARVVRVRSKGERKLQLTREQVLAASFQEGSLSIVFRASGNSHGDIVCRGHGAS
jgi:hypothetical protein